jgi:hypothetical protein
MMKTKALAYFTREFIEPVKRFMVQAQGSVLYIQLWP